MSKDQKDDCNCNQVSFAASEFEMSDFNDDLSDFDDFSEEMEFSDFDDAEDSISADDIFAFTDDSVNSLEDLELLSEDDFDDSMESFDEPMEEDDLEMELMSEDEDFLDESSDLSFADNVEGTDSMILDFLKSNPGIKISY